MNCYSVNQIEKDQNPGFKETKQKTRRIRITTQLIHFTMKVALLIMILGAVSYLTMTSLGIFLQVEMTQVTATDIPKSITVNSGDTLWKIAKAHAPNGINFTDYMKIIKKENQLTKSKIEAGQILVLP